MRRKPIRVLAAVVAIVAAGFAVASVSRDPRPAAAEIVDMSHGEVRISTADEKRILNAIDTTTTAKPADELAAEGRKIFRDTSLFEDGESCQTCHAEGAASPKLGTMVHDKSAGSLSPTPPTDFDGPRDPPALWGLAKTPPFFWDGDVPTLQKAVERPVLGHMAGFVQGGNQVKVLPGGDPTARDCEPDDQGARSQACLDKAGEIAAMLIAYLKTLDPPETAAFDQGKIKLSPAALAGERLFQGKGGCIECHGGPLFTDNLVHNTGVPQAPTFDSPYGTGPLTSFDLGGQPPLDAVECAPPNAAANCEAVPRVTIAGCPQVNVAVTPATPQGRCSPFINTPQMRDLANTGPYMHNGVFTTLKQVVQFYNSDSTLSPMGLSGAEIDQLVAYLETL